MIVKNNKERNGEISTKKEKRRKRVIRRKSAKLYN